MHATAIDYVDVTLLIFKQRQTKKPNFHLYQSAINKIEHVKSILEGKENDKSKLHTMTLGAYASKEFDTTDHELAKHLSNVNYIVSQMASGLKVTLPHEQDLEYINRQKRYKKK
ncbi:immunity protein Tsi6 family protein [Serratia quinivorans]|uniref:Immunity protein Tsi6 family protein n=1 Tax=Serratia quinivorans TaxID=137545 RepID=A0ABV3UGS5_9GAMM